MADDSAEHRDPPPGRSGQPHRDGGKDDSGRAANRRRIIITTLLTPPAVITLGRRRPTPQGLRKKRQGAEVSDGADIVSQALGDHRMVWAMPLSNMLAWRISDDESLR
jgi:hypothetical protein